MPYQLTTEQQKIIDTISDKDAASLIKVSAVAGSSKSFTANKASEAMGKGPQLYIVFSKAMQQEAKAALSSNVDVKTVHGLAYSVVVGKNIRLEGSSNKKRSLIFLKAKDLTLVKDWTIKYEVLEAIDAFFASAALTPEAFLKKYDPDIATYAKAYISRMFDGTIGITHSGYLKYYHLLLAAGKVPNQPTYDLAIVDEVQDLAPVALEVFKLQKTHKYLMLGDPYQSIMGSFTYSVNAFKELQGVGTLLPLSKSFRVSAEIAPLVESFCHDYIDPDMKFTGMDYDKEDLKTHMYISKTNSVMVGQMINLVQDGTPFSSARDPMRIFELSLILASLKRDKKVYSAQYKFIERDLVTYYASPAGEAQYGTPLKFILALHSEDEEIMAAVSLIAKYGSSAIYEAAEKAQGYYKDGNKHNTWLATAHSSKG